MESHPSGDQPKNEQEHDTTAASDNWKNKAKRRGATGLGSVVRTVLGESFWHLGASSLAMVPKVPTAVYGEPLTKWAIKTVPDFVTSNLTEAITGIQLGYVATGLGSLALGAGIARVGIKHAGWFEKAVFWGSKAAVATAYLFNPAWLPVTAGISAVSTLLSMRHRHKLTPA